MPIPLDFSKIYPRNPLDHFKNNNNNKKFRGEIFFHNGPGPKDPDYCDPMSYRWSNTPWVIGLICFSSLILHLCPPPTYIYEHWISLDITKPKIPTNLVCRQIFHQILLCSDTNPCRTRTRKLFHLGQVWVSIFQH